jgi:nucleoside-diphosphate-sugar epimerase
MKQNPLSADLQHILDHTRDLWEELRGERIFITGGTGFFGFWLLESFLFANHQLSLNASATILTRNPDSAKQRFPHLMTDPAITLHKGDARTFEFPNGKYSHVIHAATETSSQFDTLDPQLRFTSNVEGTLRALDFALASGAHRLLFTSSGAVYGHQPSDLTHIPESYAGAPETTDLNSAYGQSKRVSEFLCSSYSKKYGFQSIIARCFAFVGPQLPLNANYAVCNFIRDAMTGKTIQITGDGMPYRSYLYAADLSIWLWTILFKGRSCHPYNVGSDEHLQISDLAQLVRKVVSPNAALNVAGKSIAGKSAERYVPSIDRCRSELGLQVWVQLPDAIRRTAGYYTSPIHCKMERA